LQHREILIVPALVRPWSQNGRPGVGATYNKIDYTGRLCKRMLKMTFIKTIFFPGLQRIVELKTGLIVVRTNSGPPVGGERDQQND
jgi:hypothetical protein